MEFLSSLNINALEWFIIIICGMLIGMSKVGVPGVSMIVVPALAFIFGAKASTGVLLPILMMADIFGVAYYRRHANWAHLVKVIPWAVVGLFLALWVGEIVNDEQFKNLIAIQEKETVSFSPVFAVHITSVLVRDSWGCSWLTVCKDVPRAARTSIC